MDPSGCTKTNLEVARLCLCLEALKDRVDFIELSMYGNENERVEKLIGHSIRGSMY